MAAIEPGRICYKTAGRDAGKRVVVVEVEGVFATVVGKDGKKKKCNIRHLFPTKERIEIKNKSVEEILKSLK
ncbi:MAG: 50S ribosomal protein L14e [Candidatus Diapherotrites archaeon]|nr:50S ribosomal protein L14e [Candidatus Diapherotrites archaeon]